MPVDAVNLMPSTFETLDSTNMPVGWKISKTGTDAAVVSVVRDQTDQNIVSISIAEEANVFVDTLQPAQLDAQKQHVLVVQLRVTNMHYTGNWYRRPAGIRIYVYGMNNKHSWLAVNGQGDTDGWVTTFLPFLTRDNQDDAQEMSRPRVYLRCYNMTGTVEFRNPVILQQPSGVDMTRGFGLPDGTRIDSGSLTLYPESR